MKIIKEKTISDNGIYLWNNYVMRNHGTESHLHSHRRRWSVEMAKRCSISTPLFATRIERADAARILKDWRKDCATP